MVQWDKGGGEMGKVKFQWGKLEYVLIAFIILLPNRFIGEEAASALMLGVGCLYIIKLLRKGDLRSKSLQLKKEDKIYMSIVAVIILSCFIALSKTYSISKALGSTTLYINLVLYYIIFKVMKEEKSNIYRTIKFTIAIVAILSITIEGAIYKNRIIANLGYANSFALLLLIGLYFVLVTKVEEVPKVNNKDKRIESNKISSIDERLNPDLYFEIIYLLGILHTGSRTTIMLLLPYLALDIYFSLKSNRKISSIYGLIVSLVLYVMINKISIAGAILAPIVILLAVFIYKNVKTKIFNRLLPIIVGILIIGAFTLNLNLNTFNRIKNISLKNASLNERFVMFKDSINAIKKEPMGHGMNSFQYNQYKDATGSYDAKYIHNSFIQAYYDLGIMGGTAFLVLFIYGILIFLAQFRNINRGQTKGRFINKDKESKGHFITISNRGQFITLALYLSIYIHSLLDFDFSFSNIALIPVMLIALTEVNKDKNQEEIIKEEPDLKPNLKQRVFMGSSILLAIISFYIALNGTVIFRAVQSINSQEVLLHENIVNNLEAILIKDYEFYKLKGDIAFQHYRNENKEEDLKEALSYYKRSEELNQRDPVIKWNISYFYEKLGNYDEVMIYKDKVLENRKFYKEDYEDYKRFLLKAIKEDEKNQEIYNKRIQEIEKYKVDK